ncbi:NDR1/HIN1-like protein 6 [Malania oleifera]|uniref:NDR1/HIN1-like protein 6 n=1 Tax=Malania oleifera TaxID=397392 RepID=UPI0025ADCD06|nr:NDR1/HIN1-like protein 6 [Malania oleifera]
MADHQKVHPVQDAGAHSPSAPLMQHGGSRSEKGDPAEQELQYPPFRRNIPVMHSKPPKRRGCCCRCLCWTVCLLLVLIVVICAVLGILYLVFQPKLPKYSVDSMRITQFNMGNDMSLSATFNVTVTARNPNKKIGIYYENGSHLSAWYTGTKLCEGTFPKFYQGHRNTTVLNLALTGQTQNASDLLTTVQQEQQSTGSIPLNLRAKVPVRVKLGKLKLMKVKFRVRCRVLVDSLTADNSITIKSSSCKFRFKL